MGLTPQLGPVGVDFGPREGLSSCETGGGRSGERGRFGELREAHDGYFGAGSACPLVDILTT